MPYMDVWMYNSRPRMRVFLCYLLIFVAFFIFSDIMINCYIGSLYQQMASYEVYQTVPEVTVEEATATTVNGSVKGTVINNTNSLMQDQYLKFEFYTPRNVVSGIKYLELGELTANQKKNYELDFRYDNISSVKISSVEKSNIEKDTPEELEINPVIGPVSLLGGILYLFL